ncbi:unnamed protein product [Urochloa humidicola]
MDASRRQSGIQQLLAAEQEAQQIINAARAAYILQALGTSQCLVLICKASDPISDVEQTTAKEILYEAVKHQLLLYVRKH